MNCLPASKLLLAFVFQVCLWPSSACDVPAIAWLGSCDYESAPLCYNTAKMGSRSSSSRRLGGTAAALPFQRSAVHYDVETKTVPRHEVVAAVKNVESGGEENVLDVESGGEEHVLYLTGNGMSVDTDDFTKAFTVTNSFFEEYPNNTYVVSCPAESEGDRCDVNPEGLVKCHEAKDDAISATVPAECRDVPYRVSLAVRSGPHFFLSAERNPEEDESNGINEACPSNVAFSSYNGRKKSVMVFEDDLRDLPSHVLGTAALGDIIEAERTVRPLEDDYDIAVNSCAHYAGRIWRGLGFEETADLADFIVENAVEDEHFEDVARSHPTAGGRRVLAALGNGGRRALRKYWKGVVYSQLNID